ncbi:MULTISPECIES: 3'-5' exoribonuclease [unclassified Burkholderia]|uniref:3'-5' exoribonuclease n=1 Tax=unclassified Burkholderia TaxID=2613784 RepID=UPI002AB0065C|nr:MULTISPECIES: 3'-5' exoribonuclease [unclassified Burkholderia]
MRIFLDTEFTDLLTPDLISIALVAEDGREFYGERNDFDAHTCSVFTHEVVLPQLGHLGQAYSRAGLADAVLVWLDKFPSTQDSPGLFCMDHPIDWGMLVDLLDGAPQGWRGEVTPGVDQARRESYFRAHGGRHHALHDARALRSAAIESSALHFCRP